MRIFDLIVYMNVKILVCSAKHVQTCYIKVWITYKQISYKIETPNNIDKKICKPKIKLKTIWLPWTWVYKNEFWILNLKKILGENHPLLEKLPKSKKIHPDLTLINFVSLCPFDSSYNSIKSHWVVWYLLFLLSKTV